MVRRADGDTQEYFYDVVAGQYVETDAGRYVGPPEKH